MWKKVGNIKAINAILHASGNLGGICDISPVTFQKHWKYQNYKMKQKQ